MRHRSQDDLLADGVDEVTTAYLMQIVRRQTAILHGMNRIEESLLSLYKLMTDKTHETRVLVQQIAGDQESEMNVADDLHVGQDFFQGDNLAVREIHHAAVSAENAAVDAKFAALEAKDASVETKTAVEQLAVGSETNQ